MDHPVSSLFNTHACTRCSSRKVKCDRRTPICTTCIRHNVVCSYRLPRPSRRKLRKLVKDELVEERLRRYDEDALDKGHRHRQQQQYSHGGQTGINWSKEASAESDSVLWQLPTPASASTSAMEAESTIESEGQGKVGSQDTIVNTGFKPQLLRSGQKGKGTKLVDNSLWSRVAEEIHQQDDALEEEDDDIEDEETSVNDVIHNGISPTTAINNDLDYILAYNASPSRKACHHPPPSDIHTLWQIFLSNVNPLSKIIHVPTLQPAMEKAIAKLNKNDSSNSNNIPRGFEALMFAIYSTAILSLTDSECQSMFSGEPRSRLLSRYVSATKLALSRAKFMSSTSLVILQALLLHLVSIRDTHEPRALWSLTGTVIRISENMGLHIDGTLLGLSPFETEMRRRIWWQLQMHDFRAAELSGQAKLRKFNVTDDDESRPKKPANVNDEALWPEMSHPPVGSDRPTEMIWCMLRSEMASFAGNQKARMHLGNAATFMTDKSSSVDQMKIKDSLIRDIQDMIETKFLRFCDPTDPLQFMVLAGGRTAANLMRFIAHHPRNWSPTTQVPEEERKLVWRIDISLLEQYNMMQTSSQLRRFAWNVPHFIQWHAVIDVLDTLRANPLHRDADKLWGLIDTLFENNLEMLLAVNTPLFVVVGNLCLKAYHIRCAAATQINQKDVLPDPPVYISRLEERRRKAVKAKRQKTAIANNRRQKEKSSSERRVPAQTTSRLWPDANIRSPKTPVGPQSQKQQQQYPMPITNISINPIQGSNLQTTGDDDAFWLNNNAPDVIYFYPYSTDIETSDMTTMMNLDMDLDAILAQDAWLDTHTNEVIDWAQWDAWLGNIDPVIYPPMPAER